MALDVVVNPGVVIGPTEAELVPIKRALNIKFLKHGFETIAPTEHQMDALSRHYYKIHGMSINEETLEMIAHAYSFGYQKGKSVYETDESGDFH